MMQKVDLKGGEVITEETAFHSKTEVNLESTNSSELFSKMNGTVLQSLAKAIINLKNEDDKWFKWAITRALIAVENNSGRIDRKLREKAKVFYWADLKCPVV